MRIVYDVVDHKWKDRSYLLALMFKTLFLPEIVCNKTFLMGEYLMIAYYLFITLYGKSILVAFSF